MQENIIQKKPSEIIRLVFKSDEGFVEFNIDRRAKRFCLKSQETQYENQDMEWRMLWDKCMYHSTNPKKDNSECDLCKKKVDEQDKTAERLSDEEFKSIFQKQMSLYGYTLEN